LAILILCTLAIAVGVYYTSLKIFWYTFVLKSEHRDIRAKAIYELTQIKDPRVIEPLVTVALYDTDEILRMMAVTSFEEVCKHGNKRILNVLIKIAETDESPNVRSHTVDSYLMRTEKAVDVLVKILQHDSSYMVRLSATVQLSLIRDRRAKGALIAALKDASPAVRAKVARALERLGDVKVIEPLKNAVVLEKDTYVRGVMQEALKKLESLPDEEKK